jgi:acetylornithine deacetylase/succinyl-diaminopimelate desuccinylase-like protein
MDGRILPGMTTDDLINEIYDVIGRDTANININVYDPGPGDADMGLFDTLADVLKEAEPGAIPIPFVMCGVTDARFFCRLGIQTYGYLPMNLPDGMDIWGTIHNADERVPAQAIEFGTNAIYTALQRFT